MKYRFVSTLGRSFHIVFVAALAMVVAVGSQADEAQFQQDLQTLVGVGDHRLSGTEEGHAAAAYIEQRLGEIGIKQVYPLDMVVWQTKVHEATLDVGGQTLNVVPLRPNITATPVTPEQGLTGPLVYVGRGSLEEYGDRSVEGAIVAMDYASHDNWERAFALGAQAVIFVGNGEEVEGEPKHLGIPSNLVRMYLPPAEAKKLDLSAAHPQATLRSRITWETRLGRNIIARIPGTAPDFANSNRDAEAIVLAANYDTFGVMPHLSPGARDAANVAALLEAAQRFQANPPRRDVILMFLDNQARYHQGAREVYAGLLMSPSEHKKLLQSNAAELPYVRDMIQLLKDGGLDLTLDTEKAVLLEKWLQDTADFAKADIADLYARTNLRIRPLEARMGEIDARLEEAEATAATQGVDVAEARRLLESLQGEIDIEQPLKLQAEMLKARLAPLEEHLGDLVEEMFTLDRERAGLVRERGPMGEEARRLYDLRLRWDEVRRGLHTDTIRDFFLSQAAHAKGEFTEDERDDLSDEDRRDSIAEAREFVESIFPELVRRTMGRLQKRVDELEVQVAIDQQREALRRALYVGDKPIHIALHVDYNFGDASQVWGVVVGDHTDKLFAHRIPAPEADAPGWYSRVLDALKTALESTPVQAPHLDMMTLRDTMMGLMFAPSPFVSSGWMAGGYGIYNISLMTGYDARVHDGQPSDTIAQLDWQRLRTQAEEGTALLHALASGERISLQRVFTPKIKSKLPSWSPGKPVGDYATLAVSGDLQEDRPAAGAMLAIWPGNNNWKLTHPWTTMLEASQIANYDPMVLEPVNANGRFRLLGMREDIDQQVMLLGTLYDPQGAIEAITTQETVSQSFTNAIRVNLFVGRGYETLFIPTYNIQPQLLSVLKASIDAKFQPTKSLTGQLDAATFFYISDQIVDRRVKLFQPMGPVVLNIQPEREGDRYGTGIEADEFLLPRRISDSTAQDLWLLNEQRLSALRSRGVTSADLEVLHSHARASLDQAREATTIAEREAALAQAAAQSQRVYRPLRASMDDLVYSVVILLLLAIPFAFAMERLVVCATSIYGRIGGFTLMFLITFGLLYFMHPGFAIASTPIIIFLAFAIILLSSLVIYIVVRKFKTELKAIQGQAVGLHEIEVSQAGTMLAAVGMGMSTMRRRPTRTTLTAITVVMLTFTILCFASFSRTVGVRSLYEGPVGEGVAADILVRNLDFSEVPLGVLDMFRGEQGGDGLIAGHWWLTREAAEDPAYTVTRPDTGQWMQIDAIMGVPAAELSRWPEMADAFGDDLPEDPQAQAAAIEQKQQRLSDRGVYLPDVIRSQLDLQVGQEILLYGRRAVFAGTIDSTRLQTLKHLDGESVLPVDFRDMSGEASSQQTNDADEEMLLVDDVQKDFVHLSANQVAVVSADLARELGGSLHLINIHTGENVPVLERGRDLAEIVVMPVWAAGPEGVERMLLTVLTEVSGGLALGVPLVLGGLIIFGTLLGSISDREKEIYTFSALGLSPAHVGVLFFAEATVYAVVGGMGGQLLAQIVALVAGTLARMDIIPPTSINYSSTNSLFAIGVVMATVIISAIYPAVRASKSANPGLARSWKMPAPEGDDLKLTFPFTVSAYDITGVVSFLAEHFRRHDDAGLGNFAATDVAIRRNEYGNLALDSELALAPFDLGVTQRLELSAVPSEIQGVDEVAIHAHRRSGATGDWVRANKVFMRDLRQQFLLWRTLNADTIEHYRLNTLQTLGESTRNGNGNGQGNGNGHAAPRSTTT